ncbi:MAG: hypothetical protein CL790_01305 [Chloroflexi bacterium]|nr:hypothetical protein [Chloroflexota bacterium]HCU72581.1 hypothetical protein [Chloroflexota bacterium]
MAAMTMEARANTNLGRLCLNAFRWMDTLFEARMQLRGWHHIPCSSSLVLPHLHEKGVRPADIAKAAGVTRQAVHHVLRDLLELGFVEMRTDPKDRRSKLVVFSPLGAEFDTAVRDVSKEIEQELARRIGDRAVSSLRTSLEAEWGNPYEKSRTTENKF